MTNKPSQTNLDKGLTFSIRRGVAKVTKQQNQTQRNPNSAYPLFHLALDLLNGANSYKILNMYSTHSPTNFIHQKPRRLTLLRLQFTSNHQIKAAKQQN